MAITLADRLAPILTARHFKRSATQSFTRRRGRASDRVAIDKAGRVSLTVTDKTIAPDWRAGGPFDENTFCDVPDRADVPRFVKLITKALVFFDLAADPTKLLTEAQRRYVPGFVEPTTVAPFLRAHLGAEAVATYAAGMLHGRPELWPAFLGARTGKLAPARGITMDHGSQLATMVGEHAFVDPPAKTVISTKPTSANLRSHFGLQLRAWGEPVAAAELGRVDDTTIDNLDVERSSVTDVDYAARVLAVTGVKRRPERRTPKPRYYQYEVLHGPWL